MTDERLPVFADADFADMFVEPIKRGRRPRDDDETVEVVRAGVAAGSYRSAEQAAYKLSHDFIDEYEADAFRRRIVPKIKHLFS